MKRKFITLFGLYSAFQAYGAQAGESEQQHPYIPVGYVGYPDQSEDPADQDPGAAKGSTSIFPSAPSLPQEAAAVAQANSWSAIVGEIRKNNTDITEELLQRDLQELSKYIVAPLSLNRDRVMFFDRLGSQALFKDAVRYVFKAVPTVSCGDVAILREAFDVFAKIDMADIQQEVHFLAKNLDQAFQALTVKGLNTLSLEVLQINKIQPKELAEALKKSSCKSVSINALFVRDAFDFLDAIKDTDQQQNDKILTKFIVNVRCDGDLQELTSHPLVEKLVVIGVKNGIRERRENDRNPLSSPFVYDHLEDCSPFLRKALYPASKLTDITCDISSFSDEFAISFFSTLKDYHLNSLTLTIDRQDGCYNKINQPVLLSVLLQGNIDHLSIGQNYGKSVGVHIAGHKFTVPHIKTLTLLNGFSGLFGNLDSENCAVTILYSNSIDLDNPIPKSIEMIYTNGAWNHIRFGDDTNINEDRMHRLNVKLMKTAKEAGLTYADQFELFNFPQEIQKHGCYSKLIRIRNVPLAQCEQPSSCVLM